MTQHPTDKVWTRKDGRAGRITLTRPQALNALDHDMCTAIETALYAWRDDPDVHVVIIDADGQRAFCAGGDIAAVYHAARAGDFDFGGQYFRAEYRMNALIAEYKKPVVSFMQGFVMGGGVGVGGHAQFRIVGETTQIAMPETAIGLAPDVGGSLILARAPGRVGEYLGVTGTRIGAADAIFAGFADRFIPEDHWPDLKADLIVQGDPTILPPGAPISPAPLAVLQRDIDPVFVGSDMRAVMAALDAGQTDFCTETAALLRRHSALSEELTLRLIRMTRARPDVRSALSYEFRITLRAAEQADFLEGVRAQIIDKDRNPTWGWQLDTLPEEKVAALLAPVPPDWEIRFI